MARERAAERFCLIHSRHIGQGLAPLPHRESAYGEDIHYACILFRSMDWIASLRSRRRIFTQAAVPLSYCARVYVFHYSGVVDGRRRVRHTADRRIASARRCPAAARYILFARESRVAEMDMEIDEARREVQPAAVDDARGPAAHVRVMNAYMAHSAVVSRDGLYLSRRNRHVKRSVAAFAFHSNYSYIFYYDLHL
jgi:hypothetical protein